MMNPRKWHIAEALTVVVAGLLMFSQMAGADPRSDLDARKGDFESLKREYENRKSEVDKYLESSRALRSFDQQELEDLIKKMCGQDSERNDDEATRVSESLRDQAIGRVKGSWEKTKREWETAEEQTERLMNDLKALRENVKYIPEEESVKSDRSSLLNEIERLIDSTTRLYEKLMEDFRSLSNVEQGVMLGSNNPRIRAAAVYGQRMHIEMQSGCHASEFGISSGRPDCVMFEKDDCMVIEFKPSTWRESDARGQADHYLGDVVRHFMDKKDGRLDNCKKDSSGTPIFRAVGKTYPACTP